MPTDIEIARSAKKRPIHELAEALEIDPENIIPYGHDKAKIATGHLTAIKSKPNAKLILVKGAPLELMKARQRRFLFDQGGKLTERFGIRSVPARVRQQGRLLEISEIALPPKRRTAQ